MITAWISTVEPHFHYPWRQLKRTHTASVGGDALLRSTLQAINSSGSFRSLHLSPLGVPHLSQSFRSRDVELNWTFRHLEDRHV